MFSVMLELNFYLLLSLNSIFEVMSWLSGGTVVAEARVISRDNVCENCGGQSGSVPSSHYFPCQYYSTNAPYLSSP